MCPRPGVIDDRYVRVYERLARGGVGLIVTGNYFVHRLGIVQANNLLLDSDEVIAQLARSPPRSGATTCRSSPRSTTADDMRGSP